MNEINCSTAAVVWRCHCFVPATRHHKRNPKIASQHKKRQSNLSMEQFKRNWSAHLFAENIRHNFWVIFGFHFALRFTMTRPETSPTEKSMFKHEHRPMTAIWSSEIFGNVHANRCSTSSPCHSAWWMWQMLCRRTSRVHMNYTADERRCILPWPRHNVWK